MTTERAVPGFEAYVRARGPALLRTAYLLTGDRSAAEDLVQQALARVMLRWDRLDPARNVDGYVRRVVVTCHASRWRRRSSHEQPTSLVPDHAVPDGTAGVVDRAVLLPALRRLPARQRAAVVLRYFEDLTEADTAAAMGCSVGAVKTHTSRALASLRGLLREPPPATSPAPAGRTTPGGTP